MTDKQIIIDGVNVAECVYRAEEKCILKDDECCFFPNCDHKQKEKYKNALKEIKEIVEQGVKIHDDIIVSKQILQKIKECEVDK